MGIFLAYVTRIVVNKQVGKFDGLQHNGILLNRTVRMVSFTSSWIVELSILVFIHDLSEELARVTAVPWIACATFHTWLNETCYPWKMLKSYIIFCIHDECPFLFSCILVFVFIFGPFLLGIGAQREIIVQSSSVKSWWLSH